IGLWAAYAILALAYLHWKKAKEILPDREPDKPAKIIGIVLINLFLAGVATLGLMVPLVFLFNLPFWNDTDKKCALTLGFFICQSGLYCFWLREERKKAIIFLGPINEHPRNHLRYQLVRSARNSGRFYLQDQAHADFDYRYRLGLTRGDRGHRSGLAQDRVLAPGFNRSVQDHVPGRQRILAQSPLGWQNRIRFRSAGNRRAKGQHEAVY